MHPVLVMAFLMSGIAVAGFFYLRHQHNEFDTEVHLRVDAAAKMKATDVAAWRSQRLADAEVLSAGMKHCPPLLGILRGGASAQQQAQAGELLSLMRSRYHYDSVTIAGLRGEVLLSVGRPFTNPILLRTWTSQAGHASVIAFRNPAAASSGPAPLLSVNIALHSLQGEHLGYLLLGIDPEEYLFPTLRDWLGAGQTGELLLVRREGDSVVFLNNTRLARSSALRIRYPLSMTALPAVRAVHGESGPIDGTDYRGKVVVAAAHPVVGSDWFVVAKIDRSEALAPAVRTAIQSAVLLAALTLLSGALVWSILRRQRVRFSLEKYQAELDRSRLLSLYNSLLLHANDAILVFERDGRIVEANERAVEMFGYARDEIVQMRVAQLKPAELAVEFERHMKVIEEKKSIVFETENLRKDGRRFPTEVSSSEIVVDEHPLYQSILRDISERKQSERQIKRLNYLYAVLSRCNAAMARARSEEDLFHDVCRIAAESGGFLVSWVGQVDPVTSRVVPLASAGPAAAYVDEVIIEANEGVLGSGPAGTCFREGRPITSADFDTDPIMAPWREAAHKYNLRSIICLPVSRRGATAYILGLYSSEPGYFCEEEIELAQEVGESLSLALARIDLERDRERAERERNRAQERLELALDAANEAYWDWDIERGQIYLSPRFCTMLGYQPGELATDLAIWRGLTHPDDRAILDKEQESLKSGRITSSTVEFRARHKDGHYLWILGSAKVVEYDESGKPRRIVGSRVDITHRKSLEQQVLQAQKLESVGRLAGSVAHDFNNHLTVINGFASLLQQEAEPGTLFSESLEQIHDAGERAAALTRQLLAFSRKEIEHHEALNPNVVIEGLQKMINRLMGENVTLQLDLDPEVGFVMADASHLEQIIMNLTINARDAVARSGHVTIRTSKVILQGNEAWPKRCGPYVKLTVVDNGSGMTPEVQQHIFEPFFTTKDRSRGTGLGLSTVYGIVERTKGFIEVESELGHGSSFHVFLPSIPDPEGGAQGKSWSSEELRGGETVLVVEDDDNVRNTAVGILKHYGYQVLEAANGGDALAVQDGFDGSIDLIISDLMMPGMSGTELVQQLHRTKPHLKVIYVSGYAGQSIRKDEFLAAGAHFVPKPYTPETLLKVVREVLSGNGTTGSGAEM